MLKDWKKFGAAGEITTHAALTTGVHGAGANTILYSDHTADLNAHHILEKFFPVNPGGSGGGGTYAAAAPSSGGLTFVTGKLPTDLTSITSLVLACFHAATEAATNIDLDSMYGASTENYNQHTGSDTTSTYSLTQWKITEINVLGVFASLAAGDYFGLQVKNNSANILYCFGLKLIYT